MSIYLVGPFEAGKWPTYQHTAKGPIFFLVGAYIPMSGDEVVEAPTAENLLMHAQGIEGPVNQELQTDDEKRTVYLIEILESNSVGDTLPAIHRIITRLERHHRCKCVFRLHSDRAQELCGAKDSMAIRGVDTTGKDPNPNGRAERLSLIHI